MNHIATGRALIPGGELLPPHRRQQISLKWITQGLSNSGRKRSKVSHSSNPAIKIQEVSCVPNTPNTLVRCIGALVRRRDSEIQVIWMIISGNCNLE
jgi:hypothetical protein